jgi:nicotinamidase-related amidase
MSRTALLVIDAQNDFCDPAGNLYVENADRDMEKLGTFFDRNVEKISEIFMTADKHETFSIFFPSFWVDEKGYHPLPGTIITLEDVVNGKWNTSIFTCKDVALDYLRQLAVNSKKQLIIWPLHCIHETWGADFYPALYEKFVNSKKTITIIEKGQSLFTENYSAVQAEVVDQKDIYSTPKMNFVKALNSFDEIYVAGEALSHCVAETLRHIFGYIKKEEVKKFVLLLNATSPVSGFEKFATEFVDWAIPLGMRVEFTEKIL